MPRQGQRHNDQDDKDKSKGNNNPSKSVDITTGSYKKADTYEQQAAEGEATDSEGQHSKNDWNEDTRDKPDSTDVLRKDAGSGGRSGSESNAS